MILLSIKQFQSYLSESTYKSGTDSRHRQIIVPFSTVLILTPGTTNLLFNKYKGSFLSLGIKQAGHKPEHSTSSSAKIRNAKNYTFTPTYAFKARSLMTYRTNYLSNKSFT